MRSRLLLALALVAGACLVGCQTGEVSAVVPIAGGGKITVPMSGSGPHAGEAEGYRVGAAALQPAKEEQQVFYAFALSSKAPALKHVLVEDISDETAYTLFEDADPKFEAGRWIGKTENIGPGDPRLNWVMQLPLSLRVYRFTLTAADGHKITFNHVTTYPSFMKQAMRAKLGANY